MTQLHRATRASDPKWQFLEDVFLSNSRRDSFVNRKGRRVYQAGIKDRGRLAVEPVLYSTLRELVPLYKALVSEETHIQNICTLANRVSDACGDVLNEGRLVFGVAQKLLNSWLKYRWCAGRIDRHRTGNRYGVEFLATSAEENEQLGLFRQILSSKLGRLEA